MIDTETDIKRRKSLALTALFDRKKYYNSKNLSIKQKIRHFVMFVMSTLLYNSELWTLTNSMNNKLDAFHRRLLRYAIGVHYPKIIKNEDIYRITNTIPISRTIQKRRLSWFGHLMRLPEDTPARQAFNIAISPKHQKRGRPKTIWLDTLQNDFKELNININIKDSRNLKHLINLCSDRAFYKHITYIDNNTCCGMQGKPARNRTNANGPQHSIPIRS